MAISSNEFETSSGKPQTATEPAQEQPPFFDPMERAKELDDKKRVVQLGTSNQTTDQPQTTNEPSSQFSQPSLVETGESEGVGTSESEEFNEQEEPGSDVDWDQYWENRLAEETDKARQLQLAKLQENQQRAQLLAKLSLESGNSNVKDVASQAGSERLLDWAAGIAPALLALDVSGVSWLAAGYLNLHVACYFLGFQPFGFKLAKPKIWHYLSLVVVDLAMLGVLLILTMLFYLLVYVGQHPYVAGWEAFKAWF